MDQLSRDEIVARLSDLQKKYPQAFTVEGEYEVIENEQRTGGKLLDSIEEQPSQE
jgi:hypothetical protein